jgi:hypothetical protein
MSIAVASLLSRRRQIETSLTIAATGLKSRGIPVDDKNVQRLMRDWVHNSDALARNDVALAFTSRDPNVQGTDLSFEIQEAELRDTTLRR